MHVDGHATTIGVIIVWFLKELISSIWRNKGGVSIDEKIDYLYKREKDREAGSKAVADYISKHPSGGGKDD